MSGWVVSVYINTSQEAHVARAAEVLSRAVTGLVLEGAGEGGSVRVSRDNDDEDDET